MSGQAPPDRLAGSSVVVAGASRGIGAASAAACAAAGARAVTLLGRSTERLRATKEAVVERGAACRAVACDVTSAPDVEAAFAEVERVDVLVYSAGRNRPQPFEDVAPATIDELFAVNVRGAFLAAQAAARAMRRAREGGVIVFLSSQMGHVGAARRTVYCATKHALEGLTKALAVELAADGIRVVSVAPTFVRTEMTAAQLDDPAVGPQLLAQIPRGRFGTVEEVAAGIVYAASPAAALLTGSSLVLDGGWTAR